MINLSKVGKERVLSWLPGDQWSFLSALMETSVRNVVICSTGRFFLHGKVF
jgi:hypothetical protein